MKKRDSQPKLYAIYARVSSVEQAGKEFSSVDVQIKQCREYVESKGAIVSGVYRDDGISGMLLKRPGFQQMLSDAKEKKFEAVVVTFLNRLGRGKASSYAEAVLEDLGIFTETVKENYGTGMGGHISKEAKRFADGVLSYSIKEATSSKMEEMVTQGFFCGGTVPFGYDKVIVAANGLNPEGKEPPKRLVPHADNGPFVQEAYRLFQETQTLASVRNYLNTVTTRRWTPTSIKNLLTNEVYAGAQNFGNWRNPQGHEALVSPADWQAVQLALNAKQGSRSRREDYDSYSYYLRGNVRCPHCKCIYTQASALGRNGRVHYYTCLQANKYNAKCPVTRINADRLHYTVLHQVEHLAKHHTALHKLIANSGGWGGPSEAQKAMRGGLARKKQFLDMKSANYLNAIGEGRALNALLPALEKVETEKRLVVEELARVEVEMEQATIKRPTAEQVSEVWGEVKDLWEDLTEDERTELLGGIVQEVQVTEKNRVLLKLSPVAEVHGSWFAIKSQMGAGNETVTTNPQFFTEPLYIPVGGRNRKKIPRPERQAQVTS